MPSNQFKAHGISFDNIYFQKHGITSSAKIYVLFMLNLFSILDRRFVTSFFGELLYVPSLNVLFLPSKYTHLILVPPPTTARIISFQISLFIWIRQVHAAGPQVRTDTTVQ